MTVRENYFPAQVLLRVGCSIIFITKWRVAGLTQVRFPAHLMTLKSVGESDKADPELLSTKYMYIVVAETGYNTEPQIVELV